MQEYVGIEYEEHYSSSKKIQALVFIAEFIGGSGFSLMLPQCLLGVSKVVNARNSALATALTSCIAPSFGGFFSAMIFTNLTTALYGPSTVLRYRFVSFVVLACAVICALVFTVRKKRSGEGSA